MIGIEDWLRYLLGLIAVLALILFAARILKSFTDGGLTGSPRRFRRLGVEEFLPLDGRRRLVLLRHDEREYLVLLGQQGETLLNVADRAHSPMATGVEQTTVPAAWQGLSALVQKLRRRSWTATGQNGPGQNATARNAPGQDVQAQNTPIREAHAPDRQERIDSMPEHGGRAGADRSEGPHR